jgi:hypothetical protein
MHLKYSIKTPKTPKFVDIAEFAPAHPTLASLWAQNQNHIQP